MAKAKKNTGAKPPEEGVYAYPPDERLKALLGGVSLKDIFTPERIRACQSMIDEARAAFFDTARADFEALKQALAEAGPAADFVSLIPPASDLKSQAEAFGLTFIARLSAAVVKCCEGVLGAKTRELVHSLTDALELAFREKIDGDGGPVGREMLKELEGG